jgi:NAD(P)-dependent dehydrogenase (short-subunit alcohol dehydrogenase family)
MTYDRAVDPRFEGAMMSLVIDADGHVEENLAELVGAIPAAMQPHAMRFVSVAGGHVTYEIEGRRVCEPEDIASVVRFLVSDRCTLVTGQRIAVDGGGFGR